MYRGQGITDFQILLNNIHSVIGKILNEDPNLRPTNSKHQIGESVTRKVAHTVLIIRT